MFFVGVDKGNPKGPVKTDHRADLVALMDHEDVRGPLTQKRMGNCRGLGGLEFLIKAVEPLKS